MSTDLGGISDSSAKRFQQELTSGESLLWSGQPQRKVIFHPSDWAAIPFSLIWGGGAVFWEWAATGHLANANHTHAEPAFFALWGIPFILIGQYLIWVDSSTSPGKRDTPFTRSPTNVSWCCAMAELANASRAICRI